VLYDLIFAGVLIMQTTFFDDILLLLSGRLANDVLFRCFPVDLFLLQLTADER